MPETFKKLAQGFATAAGGALYTVPGSTQTIVREIRVVNTDSAAQTIALFDGGVAAVNAIKGTTTLQPNETMEVPCYITMAAAATIQAKASADAKVTVTVYGLELS